MYLTPVMLWLQRREYACSCRYAIPVILHILFTRSAATPRPISFHDSGSTTAIGANRTEHGFWDIYALRSRSTTRHTKYYNCLPRHVKLDITLRVARRKCTIRPTQCDQRFCITLRALRAEFIVPVTKFSSMSIYLGYSCHT